MQAFKLTVLLITLLSISHHICNAMKIDHEVGQKQSNRVRLNLAYCFAEKELGVFRGGGNYQKIIIGAKKALLGIAKPCAFSPLSPSMHEVDRGEMLEIIDLFKACKPRQVPANKGIQKIEALRKLGCKQPEFIKPVQAKQLELENDALLARRLQEEYNGAVGYHAQHNSDSKYDHEWRARCAGTAANMNSMIREDHFAFMDIYKALDLAAKQFPKDFFYQVVKDELYSHAVNGKIQRRIYDLVIEQCEHRFTSSIQCDKPNYLPLNKAFEEAKLIFPAPMLTQAFEELTKNSINKMAIEITAYHRVMYQLKRQLDKRDAKDLQTPDVPLLNLSFLGAAAQQPLAAKVEFVDARFGNCLALPKELAERNVYQLVGAQQRTDDCGWFVNFNALVINSIGDDQIGAQAIDDQEQFIKSAVADEQINDDQLIKFAGDCGLKNMYVVMLAPGETNVLLPSLKTPGSFEDINECMRQLKTAQSMRAYFVFNPGAHWVLAAVVKTEGKKPFVVYVDSKNHAVEPNSQAHKYLHALCANLEI